MAEEKDYFVMTDENFESEGKTFKGVTIVDFWAEWCGPCKAIAPIIEALATEYKDNEQVRVAKLDTDANSATAEAFRIMSIPTVKIFINKEGTPEGFEKVDEVNGYMGPATEEMLKDKLEEAIASLKE